MGMKLPSLPRASQLYSTGYNIYCMYIYIYQLIVFDFMWLDCMSTHPCIQIIWDYAMESMYCLWTFHYGLWCHIHAICPRPRLQDLPKWVQVRYHVGVGIGSEILMYKQHIALQEILSLRNRYTYLWSCLFWRRVKTLRIYERAAKTTTAIKITQSGTSKTELERKNSNEPIYT